MNLNKKILDKIDNLVKLSNDFDTEFKIIFELETTKINEQNINTLYSMTKNYISIRKEHGEIILLINKYINSINYDDILINSNNVDNIKTDDINILYDVSTFNTILNNINDLMNNVDYEYKKISIKFSKFINNKQITLILITLLDGDKKYENMIDELKSNYPENKYVIIKYENKNADINKHIDELEKYNIKIQSLNTLPLIYIVNGTIISEIPTSKIKTIDTIKNLIE